MPSEKPPVKKPKKHASKMTSDEIAQYVFPPKLHRALKKVADPENPAPDKPPQTGSGS
jgi:hypothetical protein